MCKDKKEKGDPQQPASSFLPAAAAAASSSSGSSSGSSGGSGGSSGSSSGKWLAFCLLAAASSVRSLPLSESAYSFHSAYSLAAGCSLPAAGCWLLAACCWLLAARCLPLAAGCLLACCLLAACLLLACLLLACWLAAAGRWLLAGCSLAARWLLAGCSLAARLLSASWLACWHVACLSSLPSLTSSVLHSTLLAALLTPLTSLPHPPHPPYLPLLPLLPLLTTPFCPCCPCPLCCPTRCRRQAQRSRRRGDGHLPPYPLRNARYACHSFPLHLPFCTSPSAPPLLHLPLCTSPLCNDVALCADVAPYVLTWHLPC